MLPGNSRGSRGAGKARSAGPSRTAGSRLLRRWLEQLEARDVPSVAWPEESEPAWPANWDLGPPSSEVEAKWHVDSEQHFENILTSMTGLGSVTLNGHTYTLTTPWSSPRRFTDVYYDTPTGELAEDQHVIRHRERHESLSGTPTMFMDIGVLLSSDWSPFPDRRLIQYKSTPERFGAVWFREESGNLLDSLSLEEVDNALDGFGYPSRVDNPIAEMRNDHPAAEVPFRGQPGGLAADLMVVDFRYRVVFTEGGVDKFEASFDKVRQYDLTISPPISIDFFEIEVEALRDAAGQLPAGNLDQLFVIRNWLQGNYAFGPNNPQPAPVPNPPLPNPDPLPTVLPSAESKGGAVVADHGPITLDDGATARTDLGGWSQTGTWTAAAGAGYGGDVRTSQAGTGAAVWTFDFLSPGRYKVAATWTADLANTTAATYQVFDGTTWLGNFTRNQTAAPSGYTPPGSSIVWSPLGDTFLVNATGVNNGRLVVKLLDTGGGKVVADAVRIQYVDEGPVQSAAFSLGGSLFQLVVTGTSGPDTITVAADGSGYAVVNGGRVPRPGGGELTAAEVGIVTAQALDGNDVIDLSAVTTAAFPNLSVTYLSGGTGNDTVIGSPITDNLSGDAGNDLLSGASGGDTMQGGAGNDVLLGDGGDDTLYGDFAGAYYDPYTGQVGGDDWLDAGAGNDVAFGEWYDDFVFGRDGADTLYGDFGTSNPSGGGYGGFLGYGGDDVLDGGTESDAVYGESHDDTLTGGTGSDSLYGDFSGTPVYPFVTGSDLFLFGGSTALGSDSVYEANSTDTDTLDFASLGAGVSINISQAGVTQPVAGALLSLTLSSSTGIENVIGTGAVDVITGNTRDNVLIGGAGRDTMAGGDGNDSIDGGTQDDVLTGGAGNDTLLGWTGDDNLNGGDGHDVLSGWTGGDAITGGAGNDTLSGWTGGDAMAGEGGNDTYVFDGSVNHGADTITEPASIDSDSLQFTTFGYGITINLSLTAQTVTPGILTLTISATGIENVYGSPFADTITGDGRGNYLDADGENDVITGGAGNDTLVGGAGNDLYLFGGSTSLGSDLVMEADNAGSDIVAFGGVFGLVPLSGSVTINLGSTLSQAVNPLLSLTLSSATGIERVNGTLGNDTITGNTRDNVLVGDEGNDVLSGGTGHDTLIGGEGNDVLDGGDGNDSLDGTEDLDTLTGGAGNDILEGGDDTDVYVFAGTASLGLDALVAEESAEDTDTLDFAGLGYGVTVNIGLVAVAQVVAPNLTLTIEPWFITTGLENVIGTPYPDAITGNARDNVFDGGAGQDTLSGGDGNDTLIGGSQDDAIDAGTGNDSLDGGTGEDAISGGDGNDTLIGFSGHDILSGGAGNDSFTAGTGEDTLEGGAGNDTLVGDTGSDWYVFSGSSSLGSDTLTEAAYLANDVLNFTNFGAGVSVVLSYTGAQTVAFGLLTLTLSSDVGFETVYGSAFGDYVVGNALSNYLVGAGGSDYLYGADGYDVLDGGIGTDTLYGAGDSDYLLGGDGNDVLYGDYGTFDPGAGDTIFAGPGDDFAFGEGGSDYILGEDGHDYLYGDYGTLVFDPYYGGSAVPGDDYLSGGLGNDHAYGEGGGDGVYGDDGTDTLYGDFDYAPYQWGVGYGGYFAGGNDTVGGGSGADTGFGGEYDDQLFGNDGNDVLYGDYGFSSGAWYYGGNDTLEGGAGNDTLVGEIGSDRYVFAGSGNLGSDVVQEAANQDADTLDFSALGVSVAVDLARTDSQTIHAGILSLQLSSATGIENVTGSEFDDEIVGNDRNNELSGGGGNDLILGGAGNDTLFGGAGDDWLFGGVGIDVLWGGDGTDDLNAGGDPGDQENQ